jgi:hypothetical protein
VNSDPTVTDPLFVLLVWAAGVSLAAATVTIRSVVGPGFTWLASATAALIGVWPAFTGDYTVTAAAVLVAVGGLTASWHRLVSGGALAVGAALFVIAAADTGGPMLAITATLALGGVTGEMLLGHWYLVDPTLPRFILRALAIAGILALAVDTLVVVAAGVPGEGMTVAVFLVLAATTIGLMGAVLGALRYPAYSGVMAATGLSYLAVLTGLATVFLGRTGGAGGLL